MPDLTCPLPITDYPNVLLAHGAGGQLMHQLLAAAQQGEPEDGQYQDA